MPEDQSVNGDKWTNEAGKLFSKLGWEIVGDKNVDIIDNNNKPVGIDSIFRFEDGFRPNLFQGVFFEAKRYKESTFRSNTNGLKNWITTLDDKLRRLKRSEDLLTNYPDVAEKCVIDTGLIGIWFHELTNNDFEKFKPFFLEQLSKIRISSRGKLQSNKIIVITNDKILELVSLHQTIRELAQEEQVDIREIKFFYPSSLQLGSGVNETHVLNIHYILSKFIFAKLTKETDLNLYLVFYFGEIDIHSFKRLIEAMSLYNFIHTNHRLTIYKYKRSDDFRKIKPQILNEFSKRSMKNVEIKDMQIFNDLPTWMID